MSIKINDTSFAGIPVQSNNRIGASTKGHIQQFGSTNPYENDSFKRKPIIATPYNQAERLYHKALANVAPSALLDVYLKEKNAMRMMAENPEVQYVLEKYGMPKTINVQNVKGIKKEHIESTEQYAKEIAKNLHLSKEDQNIITKGAIFHDYGKILIPRDLLEKNGRLTTQEKRMVDQHALLGYEMLKNTPLESEVLEIIKDHHKPLAKNPDYKTQIVSVADIYSALRTQRSYKEPLTKEQSMAILNKYAKLGQIDPQIVEALSQSELNSDVVI